MRKRGWVAIDIDILESALIPQKKTRIMYKANLNYDCFNRHFHDLVKKGFIVTDDNAGNTSYLISDRGRTFLTVLRKAQDLASVEEH